MSVVNLITKPNAASSIGDRLEEARRQLNISKNDMAQRLGVSETCYSAFEKTKIVPTTPILIRLYTDFGVSIDWLLFDRGQAFTKPPMLGHGSNVIRPGAFCDATSDAEVSGRSSYCGLERICAAIKSLVLFFSLIVFVFTAIILGG